MAVTALGHGRLLHLPNVYYTCDMGLAAPEAVPEPRPVKRCAGLPAVPRPAPPLPRACIVHRTVRYQQGVAPESRTMSACMDPVKLTCLQSLHIVAPATQVKMGERASW